MKKIMAVFAVGFLLGFPLAAMSATTFTGNAEPTGEDVTGIINQFRTSTNVTLIALGTTSTYAAVAGHLNGTREFGSSSGDSKLYWQSKEVGAVTQTAPTESDSSAFVGDDGKPADGWSAL
jgi:hypothetical protein